MTNQILTKYLTTLDAANSLGVAHRTMRRYALSYPGLSVKVANRRLIDREVLDHLLATGTLTRRADGQEACDG